MLSLIEANQLLICIAPVLESIHQYGVSHFHLVVFTIINAQVHVETPFWVSVSPQLAIGYNS